MEILGIVKKISDTQTFNSGFKKRELVITTEEQYPQHILVEFIQDKIDLLDSLKPNDKIKVSINLRGREWINNEGITKYFNSIQGWRIEKIQVKNSNFLENNSSISSIEKDITSSDNEFDDLPF